MFFAYCDLVVEIPTELLKSKLVAPVPTSTQVLRQLLLCASLQHGGLFGLRRRLHGLPGRGLRSLRGPRAHVPEGGLEDKARPRSRRSLRGSHFVNMSLVHFAKLGH